MPGLEKIRDFVIYKDENYNTFPNAVVLPEGDVMVGFRQALDRQKEFGKVTHVDPTSKAVYVLSSDNAISWGKGTATIFDDEEGEQDPCLNLLKDATIVCTFFKWKTVKAGESEKLGDPTKFKHYGRNVFGIWDAIVSGAYSMISQDFGHTWTEPIKIEVGNYVHGIGVRGNIVELDDGTLLLPMYGAKNFGETSRAFVVKSEDKGMTWKYLADIAYCPDKNFYEPFIYRTVSGRIVALLRTQSVIKDGMAFDDTYLNLHTCVSEDNGKSWSEIKEERVWSSNPIHALRLQSGNVLLTYGYRREPFGIRGVLVDGELSNIGMTEEFILKDDAPNGDLGYTSSVQLSNGDILVTYYYCGEDSIRYIAGSILREK